MTDDSATAPAPEGTPPTAIHPALPGLITALTVVFAVLHLATERLPVPAAIGLALAFVGWMLAGRVGAPLLRAAFRTAIAIASIALIAEIVLLFVAVGGLAALEGASGAATP